MSFGDGLAQSIGQVGNTIISTISNSTAIVNSDVVQETIKDIFPINDADSAFEKKVLVKNLCDDKITINSETQYISSYIKKHNIFLASKDEVANIVTTTVNQYYPSSAIMKATCWVKSEIDTKKNIIPYLIIDDKKIHSNPLLSIGYTQSININKPKLSFCRNIKLQQDNKQLLTLGIEVKTKVYDIDNHKAIINNAFTFVENNVPYNRRNFTVIQPVTVSIEDYKPPNTTTSFDGGLKGFRIVVQKYSYFEQYLSFSKGGVSDIVGLPMGMTYENGYLKGSPLLSGDFNISMKMEDNTTLSGLLIVTQVPREL